MDSESERQLLAQVAAVRVLVSLLLADKLGDSFDPVKAIEKLLASVFRATTRDASMPEDDRIRLSEAIASMVHEAARLAAQRGLRKPG
jgi:hypothetical protein